MHFQGPKAAQSIELIKSSEAAECADVFAAWLWEAQEGDEDESVACVADGARGYEVAARSMADSTRKTIRETVQQMVQHDSEQHGADASERPSMKLRPDVDPLDVIDSLLFCLTTLRTAEYTAKHTTVSACGDSADRPGAEKQESRKAELAAFLVDVVGMVDTVESLLDCALACWHSHDQTEFAKCECCALCLQGRHHRSMIQGFVLSGAAPAFVAPQQWPLLCAMCEDAVTQFVPLWLRQNHIDNEEDDEGQCNSDMYNHFFAAVFLKVTMLSRPISDDLASASWAQWLLTMRHLRCVLRERQGDDDSSRLPLWAHFGPDEVHVPSGFISVARFSTVTIALPACGAHGWSKLPAIPDTWSKLPAATAAALLTTWTNSECSQLTSTESMQSDPASCSK